MARNKAVTVDLDQGLLTTGQAAKILGVTPRTMINWRNLGKGPRYIRLGKIRSACRYERAALEAFLLSRTVHPVAA